MYILFASRTAGSLRRHPDTPPTPPQPHRPDWRWSPKGCGWHPAPLRAPSRPPAPCELPPLLLAPRPAAAGGPAAPPAAAGGPGCAGAAGQEFGTRRKVGAGCAAAAATMSGSSNVAAMKKVVQQLRLEASVTRVKVRRGAAPPLPPGDRAPPRSEGAAGPAAQSPGQGGGRGRPLPSGPPGRRPSFGPGAPLPRGSGRALWLPTAALGPPSAAEGPRCPFHGLPLGRGCSQHRAGRAGCSAGVCNRLPRLGWEMEASLPGERSTAPWASSGRHRAVPSQRSSEQTARTG